MKKFVVLYIVVFLLFSLSACKQTDDIGTFYNLREAYEEGLLTVENVQSIADYYHGTLEYSKSLDKKVAQKIKETRVDFLKQKNRAGTLRYPEAKTEGVTILRYLGEYKGSFAVMIKDVYYERYLDYDLGYYCVRPDIVANIEFNYYDDNSILIWVDETPSLPLKIYESGLPLEDEERLAILELCHNWAEIEFDGLYSFKGKNTFTYYGQYNGFYILKFTAWTFGVIKEEIIDGLNFSRHGSEEIYAISDDIGKTLKEAYEEGYLTRNELKEIHKMHMNIMDI